MKCPDPGVYRDIPAEQYFEWDAVSNSKLSLMNRSPMHYKHGFGESSPAMRLGSLVHSGVLEPLSIAKRYVFMPNYASHPGNVTGSGDRSFSPATKFVKSMQEEFISLHHDKEIVTEAEFDTMIGMASSLQANKKTRDMLRDGISEVCVTWFDERTGLHCKARIDWLKTEDGLFCDLKTTQDASDFERSIVRFGYHRQMAFYSRGLIANGIEVEPWILAVEKSAPYGCRTAVMSIDAIDHGEREIDQLLKRVAECEQSGLWPGYDNPAAWSCPDWYGKNDEVDLVIGGEVVSV